MTSLQTSGSTDVTPRSAALRGVNVVLHVNGRQRLLQVDSRVTLLDALREHLGLIGTEDPTSRLGVSTSQEQRVDRPVNLLILTELLAAECRLTHIQGCPGTGGRSAGSDSRT